MKLRTEIKIPPSPIQISHGDPLYFMGSCFSENMVNQCRYYGFNALASSHGIIYNPVSIQNSLADLAAGKIYTQDDLEFYQGNYFSYHHHGSYQSSAVDELLELINKNITLHRDFLTRAKLVFITLGTAWVYVEKHKNKVVANCHKLPGTYFNKVSLTLSQLEESLKGIGRSVQQLNPAARVVFTVSPVKHLADGFVENQYSKSLLHVAVQQQCSGGTHYFPAYEIMVDDLRDYRFWKEDMIHPGPLAIEYIWNKMAEVYLTAETREVMAEVKKFRQFESHRALTQDEKKIAWLRAEKEKMQADLLQKFPQLIL
jgi:hypothetical protein